MEQNIRDPKEAKHDRDEARIHAADIVSIVRDNIQKPNFKASFWSQFREGVELKERTFDIISKYFVDLTSSGMLLYAEFLRMQEISIDESEELNHALREVRLLL